MQQQANVVVIGFGGCGGKIVSKMVPFGSRHIFDSSTANAVEFAKDVPLHLLSGGNFTGAGKDPARIVKALQAEMPDVVSRHVPEGTDLTILVTSTSGGTGSISSQVALHELLASKRTRGVLVCLVQHQNSLADISNTVSCLNNLQSAAYEHDTNITLYRVPSEVAGEAPGQHSVMTEVEQDGLVLSMLATLKNLILDAEGFDPSDLISFLSPPVLKKIDGMSGGVSCLELNKPGEEVDNWWGGEILHLSEILLASPESDCQRTGPTPLWSKTAPCWETPEPVVISNTRGGFEPMLADLVSKKDSMTPKPPKVVRAMPQQQGGRKRFDA